LDDVFEGLSPGGLSTNGYKGHSFWDMETWMYPPLLLLDPPSAASILSYRWDRRLEAAQKAQNCGSENHAYCPPGTKVPKEGLMFPWESAFTGQEVEFSDGKIGPWGEYEQHISGDISFAARQYYYMTGDVNWLKSVGFPLIYGVASFYASRITPKGGAYDYNEVISHGSICLRLTLNLIGGDGAR